jgi:frataxin-like iron-binding protein CyaY
MAPRPPAFVGADHDQKRGRVQRYESLGAGGMALDQGETQGQGVGLGLDMTGHHLAVVARHHHLREIMVAARLAGIHRARRDGGFVDDRAERRECGRRQGREADRARGHRTERNGVGAA